MPARKKNIYYSGQIIIIINVIYIYVFYEVIILKGTKLVSSFEGPFVRYSPTGEVSPIFPIYDIIISNYY
mgnify:FL=1